MTRSLNFTQIILKVVYEAETELGFKKPPGVGGKAEDPAEMVNGLYSSSST